MAHNFLRAIFIVMLFCVVVAVSTELSPSFGFKKFDPHSQYLWSRITLVGDARVDDNGSFLRLTGPWNYSSGKVMYKRPITLYNKSSFGSYFVFSEPWDGLDFVLLGNGFAVEFAVGFEAKIDRVLGGFSDVRVRINVGKHVSTKVVNASDVELRLNDNGDKLQCWIDFEASSKRIEVRINKWGEKRPINPTISHLIDLSSMFNNEEVFIALSSSNTNTNTTQVCKLYSWSFKIRQVPTWMHSQPLDPEGFKKDADPVVVVTEMHKRGDCIVRLITALVFGTGCGAMGAFIVLCVWSVFVNKKPVAPEEYVVQPVVFDYEKVKVVVIDKSDSSKK